MWDILCAYRLMRLHLQVFLVHKMISREERYPTKTLRKKSQEEMAKEFAKRKEEKEL